LSEGQIDYLVAHATANKQQRYKPWPVIAQECGLGDISQATIYRAFEARGYTRARPRKKPYLTKDQKTARYNFAKRMLYELRTGADVIVCVDEAKATAGIVGERLVTRTSDELWHEDCVEPKFDKRTGLLFFGIIGRNFKGKCYIFDPESPEERKRIQRDWEASVQPQFNALLEEYEWKLQKYEQAKAAQAAAKGKAKATIKTGRKPRKPTMKLFPHRNPNIRGVDWYRYVEEVVKPILRPELERFIEEKDPWCLPKLIQDNAGAHEKAVNDGYFMDMPCELLRWPSDSPDLNPIEHIWEWIRRQISSRYGYLKANQVRGVWLEMWKELPISVINKAMDHFLVVLQRCVDQQGDNRYNG
jgi:hypothetical protein